MDFGRENSLDLNQAKRIIGHSEQFQFGKPGYPPSPRSLGIIGLGGKCIKILGAQQLTGKILLSKDLACQPGLESRLALGDDGLN